MSHEGRYTLCLLAFHRPPHLSGNEAGGGAYIAFDAGMVKGAQAFGSIIYSA
jgi:hypothetical protein